MGDFVVPIISVGLLVSPVIMLFALVALGLRKYRHRKREDENTQLLDIREFQLVFIGFYAVSFIATFLITTNDGGKEFYVPIAPHNNHYTPFSGPHLFSLVVYDLLAALPFAVVCLKWRKQPPLALALCLVFLIMGIAVNGLAIAQYGGGLINILKSGEVDAYVRVRSTEIIFKICCRALNTALLITLLVTVVLRERQAALARHYKNKFLNKINTLIGARYFLWAFILLVPAFVIITLILLLFGQEYDSMAKVFTETTTWAFSQREHPPNIPPQSHYLCTVAACGHPRVVRPLRLGQRRGETIIVNRQLQVANAFEDMIMRRCGRIHGVIRFVYDRCGYPISKHITNKYASDVVYVLMKPLEYFFLVCLYLFEVRPEVVINRQYAEHKHPNTNTGGRS